MSKIIQLVNLVEDDGATDILALHEDGNISRLVFEPPTEDDGRYSVMPIFYKMKKPQ